MLNGTDVQVRPEQPTLRRRVEATPLSPSLLIPPMLASLVPRAVPWTVHLAGLLQEARGGQASARNGTHKGLVIGLDLVRVGAREETHGLVQSRRLPDIAGHH